MVDYPERGSRLWDGPLKDYIDASQGAALTDASVAQQVINGAETQDALDDFVSPLVSIGMAEAALSSALPLRACYNRLAMMEKGTATQLWYCFTGTSVAANKINEMYTDLARQCGGFAGAVNAPGGQTPGSPRARAGVGPYAPTGTPTSTAGADYAVMPGVTTTLPSGSSYKYGVGGGTTTFDKAEVGYFGGTGTLEVRVGGSLAATIDVSDTTAGVFAIRAIPVASRAKQEFQVSCTAGSVKIGSVGLWDSTATGLVVVGMAAPGMTYANLSAQAWANYRIFMARYNPDIVTWEAKGGQWVEADLRTMLTSLRTAVPRSDVLLIGSTPDNGGAVPGGAAGTDQLSYNRLATKIAREYRPTLNVMTWDGYGPLESWAQVVAIDDRAVALGATAGDWKGDGVHLGWRAQAFLAALLLRDLGFDRLFRDRLTRQVLGAGVAVQIGTNLSDPVMSLESDPTFDTDAFVKLKRGMRVTRRSDGAPIYGFSALAGNSFIPADTTIGEGGAGVGRAPLVYQVTSAALNVAQTTTAVGSTQIFYVTLSANATLSMTGSSVRGQQVRVHLIQDATGGRSVGLSGALRARTGFTVDTGANRRTTVDFEANGSGAWFQVGTESSVSAV